jgi:hypothetical protein
MSKEGIEFFGWGGKLLRKRGHRTMLLKLIDHIWENKILKFLENTVSSNNE